MAIEAVFLDTSKNKFDTPGLNVGAPANSYFPCNGGLLYAVAMMAAGSDGAPNKHAPGFPNDGTWVIEHGGLNKVQ